VKSSLLLLSDCYKVGKKAELRFHGDGLEGSEEGCDIFRSLFRLQLHNTIVIAAISLLHLFRGAGVRQIKLPATCIHDEIPQPRFTQTSFG
jgi:hypothetical protein